MTEEELVQGCIKGLRKAQEELYRRFAPKMLGICARYAGNRDEAEDFLQEAMIKVYQNMGSFRLDGSLEGWIRRVVVNTALNHLRSRKITEDVDTALLSAGYEDFSFLKPETMDLLRMIQSLPDGYRVVFNLYAIEGFSHREIAESLGIEEASSRSQLARARKLLQEMLTKEIGIKAS